MFFGISVLFFWLKISDVTGLKITRLYVPRLVDVRGTAFLTCDFDLETSKLYSVKWYKDDLEFCRFMPNGNPDVQIFQVEGVHISAKQCNMTTVSLNQMEFSTSGLYACEVSTEAPYFKTVQTASNMTVLGIPEKNPVVSGLENIYAVGDYVAGNCTSDASYPPAEIDWYINGNRVESWQLKNYPLRNGEDSRLKSSILGVSFQVDHSYFSGKGNTMVLKCLARVGEISKQAIHISKLADLDVEKYAQGLYGNKGSRTKNEFMLLTLFTIAVVVVKLYSEGTVLFQVNKSWSPVTNQRAGTYRQGFPITPIVNSSVFVGVTISIVLCDKWPKGPERELNNDNEHKCAGM